MAFLRAAIFLPAVLSASGCGSDTIDAHATSNGTHLRAHVISDSGADLDALPTAGTGKPASTLEHDNPRADGGLPRDVPDAPDAALPDTCVLGEKSSLPNVHIVIDASTCVFTLAQARSGISIPYEIVIDDTVQGFIPAEGYAYGPNVSGLEVTERIEGRGQRYCDCDHGLRRHFCPGPACGSFALDKGTFPRTFTWNGTNWNGSADTEEPLGQPFPPGDYVLTISTTPGFFESDGGAPLKASAEFLIRLVK